MPGVRTCLWFDRDGEAAVETYVALVRASRIEHVQRAPSAWPGGATGEVLVINFHLAGQRSRR